MTNAQKIKVALIGYGHLGVWHAQKCEELANCELYAIVEESPENQEKARVKFPHCLMVSNLHEVIDKIDAGLVVTPTSIHFEICKKLLENNKHVFCEKPFTANLEEAIILQTLSKEKDVVIQIGHSERFHKVWDLKNTYPDFFKGDASVQIHRCAPFKGRATDVSVVSDLMIHDLDLVLYLFDETPTSLKSKGYKIRTNEYDYVSTTLFYECGKEVVITNSRNDTDEKRSFVIVNKLGTLTIDLMNYKYSIALGSSCGPKDFVESHSYPKSDHLLIEQEYFYESILNSKKAIVTLEDGLSIVKLIDKVHESLESSQTLKIELT